MIALDDQGRVALVRQYRHPVRHRLIEPPAGLLDVDGEAYVLGAQRELAEEVGLAAGTWHVLVDLFTTPGILGESLRIFLARDLLEADAPDGFVRAGEEAHMDTVWALAGRPDGGGAGRQAAQSDAGGGRAGGLGRPANATGSPASDPPTRPGRRGRSWRRRSAS